MLSVKMFLNLSERQVLLDLFERYIPKFTPFKKRKKKLDIDLKGIHPEKEVF